MARRPITPLSKVSICVAKRDLASRNRKKSRKTFMPEKTFQQILSEKLAPRGSVATPPPPSNNAATFRKSSAFWIGEVPIAKVSPQLGAKAYAKGGASTPNQNWGASPARPPHVLSATQALAFAFFQSQIALSAAFTAKELKSSYRRLAKRLHPDHGGKSDEFHQLQEAFRELSLLF